MKACSQIDRCTDERRPPSVTRKTERLSAVAAAVTKPAAPIRAKGSTIRPPRNPTLSCIFGVAKSWSSKDMKFSRM